MLKVVLLANSASCAIFGALFVLYASATSAFIGNPPELLLRIVGTGLLLNAALLIVTALRAHAPRRDLLFFIAGDIGWVVCTALLVLSGTWINTASGVAWSLAIALFVALCALLQWRFVPNAKPMA